MTGGGSGREGGRALNIVPAECRLQFEIRALPSQDADALENEIRSHARDHIEPEMKAAEPTAGFDIAAIDDTVGFNLPDDDPANLRAQPANPTSRRLHLLVQWCAHNLTNLGNNEQRLKLSAKKTASGGRASPRA